MDGPILQKTLWCKLISVNMNLGLKFTHVVKIEGVRELLGVEPSLGPNSLQKFTLALLPVIDAIVRSQNCLGWILRLTVNYKI